MMVRSIEANWKTSISLLGGARGLRSWLEAWRQLMVLGDRDWRVESRSTREKAISAKRLKEKP
jgi:hypothetical protein